MLSKPVHSLCHVVCIRPVSFYCKWRKSNFIWLWLKKKKETSLTCNECQGSAGVSLASEASSPYLELPFSLTATSAFFSHYWFWPPHQRWTFSQWAYRCGHNAPRHSPFTSSPWQRERLAFLGSNCKNTPKRLNVLLESHTHTMCGESRILWLVAPFKTSFSRWVRCTYPKEGLDSIAVAIGRIIRGREAAQFVSTTLWHTFFFKS